MKKYLPSWFVIAFASGILITGITVVIPGAVADDIVAQSAAVELFMDVFSRTVTSYVDSLESRELVEAALRGMLESLDPNSILMNPEDYENFHISMEGSFQGVGITIGIRDEWLTVIAPLEGTPAFRAGMKAGDRIVMIDSMSTEGININEAVSHIRGPRGSFVLLTVERPGINDSLLFNIERDNIELPCISASIMLDSLTGYMRLSQFTNSSALDVELALKELEK
nr:PDZ domain-containing protein [FCB group bacterium]